jgi:predicted nucleotidyltransferase
VSGEIPVVTLLGAEASRLIVALQRLVTDAPPFTLVGGLAVLARLASVNPYRATGDLYAVTSGHDRDDFLEVLKGPGVRAAPRGDGLLVGDVEVDIIPTGEIDFNGFENIPEKDAIFVLSHHWAMKTSKLLTIADGIGATATCPTAIPPALVAMKLGSVQNRRNERPYKVASDSRDLYFLLQKFDRDGSIAEAIRLGPLPLVRSSQPRPSAPWLMEPNSCRGVCWSIPRPHPSHRSPTT